MTFLKSMLEQTGELGPEDRRHLDMANWWVGLGYFKDASDELNKINRLVRAHPDVLCVRWKVYSSAGRWELAAETARALSERTPASYLGWVLLARSLHGLERTKEARDTLKGILNKFPDAFPIHYDLARFSCKMGDLSEAWICLDRALEVAGTEDVLLMAFHDPDLQPLLGEMTGN